MVALAAKIWVAWEVALEVEAQPAPFDRMEYWQEQLLFLQGALSLS